MDKHLSSPPSSSSFGVSLPRVHGVWGIHKSGNSFNLGAGYFVGGSTGGWFNSGIDSYGITLGTDIGGSLNYDYYWDIGGKKWDK